MQGYFIAALAAVFCIAVFAVQNSQQITLRFLYWDFPSVPLVMMILFSAATGALVTMLFFAARQLRLAVEIRDLHGKVRTLEKRLAAGDQDSTSKTKT